MQKKVWGCINISTAIFLSYFVDFVNQVRVRLRKDLQYRLQNMERTLQAPCPDAEFNYAIIDAGAFSRRTSQYENAINNDSDVKLAEVLWSYLANSEMFEIEGSFRVSSYIHSLLYTYCR